MPKIVPCLWFDSNAEEAVNFYTSVFKNSKITNLSRYDEAGARASGKPVGSVLTIEFELDGQKYAALNGGPVFSFTPAISFMIDCKNQEEVDWFWDKLSEGGKTDQCGWLTDKFGVSWQVVPTILGKLLTDRDPAKAERVMKAMLGMTKIEIEGLVNAYEQND